MRPSASRVRTAQASNGCSATVPDRPSRWNGSTPQGDFLLDQTPAFDPTEAEPVPVFVFDQSMPHEFDD